MGNPAPNKEPAMYRIVRCYMNRNIPKRTIASRLTLEEAQAHCEPDLYHPGRQGPHPEAWPVVRRLHGDLAMPDPTDKPINVSQSHRRSVGTTYHGPTNHRGSRISVRSENLRLWVSWDYAKDPAENHASAARVFLVKYSWDGEWIGGGSPDGTGYVFVNLNRS
jgi:hypothetical protein